MGAAAAAAYREGSILKTTLATNFAVIQFYKTEIVQIGLTSLMQEA